MALNGVLARIRRLPVIRHVLVVQARYGKERAGYYADALTYQAFFAVFPALLVVSSILGFILHDDATRARVVEGIADAIPGLRAIAGDLSAGLVEARAVTGIIGLLGLAWRGITVVRSVSNALGALHHRDQGEPLLNSIGRALVSSMALGAFALAGLGLSIAAGALPDNPVVAAVLLVASIGIDVGLFMLAYRILVPGGGPRFSKLWPGAVFAAIGWGVLKLTAATLAEQNLEKATAIYGAFAVAVALLATMSFAARLFMYGAVINTLHREDAFRRMDRQHLDPSAAAVSEPERELTLSGGRRVF